jgi:LuxR family maltose regulon positive regulatory protein
MTVSVPTAAQRRSGKRPSTGRADDSLALKILGAAHLGVPREELLKRCAVASRSQLVLVEAPFGFGKTHFLLQLSTRARRAGARSAWITVRRTERSIYVFVRRLIETLKAAGIKRLPAAPTSGGLEAPGAVDHLAEQIAHKIQVQRNRVLLILDDYHLLEGTVADALLTRLFEELPTNLQVGLASRRTCSIVPSRTLLQGRLHLVGARDLLFSKSETREFFGTLGASQLNRLYADTEGWPAALKMAQLCLPAWLTTSRDIQSVAEFRRMITDYCNREMISHLDPQSQELLISCSVLDTLTPGACNSIRQRDDSGRILSDLGTHETFLEADDAEPTQWRLPGLLRECLRQRANEHGTDFGAAARIRAGSYYERVGRTLEAMRCYLDASDAEAAAAALERAAPFVDITEKGDAYGNELLELVPAEMLQSHPRLALCRAYLDHKSGLTDRARTSLTELAARTNNFSKDRPGGDDARLKTEALCVELTMGFYDRTCASLEYIHSIEAQLPLVNRGDIRLTVLCHLVLGMLYRVRGDLASSEMHFIQTQKLSATNKTPWTELWLKYHYGAHALARGQLMEARSQFYTGLKLWQAGFRSYGTYRASIKVCLAEIDYENDSLKEARVKLGEALYTVEHIEGWFELYATVYEIGMMLHWHASDLDEVEALLARGLAVPRVGVFLGRYFLVLRARFEVLRGRFDRAALLLKEQHLDIEWMSDEYLDTFAYREWDLLGQCLCQIAIATQAFSNARRYVTLLDREARRSGRARTIAKASLLGAALDLQEGKPDRAFANMLQTLQIAYPLSFRRVFLDEAALVRPLLDLVLSRFEAVPAPIANYAQRLSDALVGKGRCSSSEQSTLSHREGDVIQALSLGYSNKLIAKKLGLSAPTIKFHVNNVFHKLGVHKRAAAVAEAHRRGWLP